MSPTPEDTRTPYQKMIWRALIQKYIKNRSIGKRSQRDDIREYNKAHTVQLRLRPRLNRKDYPWVESSSR